MKSEKHLHRSRTNRQLSGVAGGIAEYLGLDPTIVRLGFLILTIFNGVGLLIYLVAWLVMPEEPASQPNRKEESMAETTSINHEAGNEPTDEPKTSSHHDNAPRDTTPDAHHRHHHDADGSGRTIGGFIMIAIGVAFLLQQTLGIDVWHYSWPLGIIAVGLYVIVKRR